MAAVDLLTGESLSPCGQQASAGAVAGQQVGFEGPGPPVETWLCPTLVSDLTANALKQWPRLRGLQLTCADHRKFTLAASRERCKGLVASLWPGPDGFQAGKRCTWSPAARTSSRAASPLSRQAALQSGGPVQSGKHVLSPPCARQSSLLGTSPNIQTSHPARVPSSTE